MMETLGTDMPALNILSLGAKNDGSEDVSAIVNEYTKTNALFFPAGRYLVAHPLVIQNPLIGAGYARIGRPDNTHTWLISAIDHDDADPLCETGVICFGGDGRFTVENLNILCHSRECGIYVNPCVQATAVYVDRVGIFDVRGYGFCAAKGEDVPGFASRPLFLGQMTIMGTSDYPETSVGIYTGGRIGDNRLSDIEIMGTRVGVWEEASFIYADNMHIWTGCLAGRDNGSWWETTRGIVLGKGDANFMGENIYVDTAFALFEFHSQRNMVSIHNFMSWEDGSIGGCDRTDAVAFLIPEPLPGEPSVNLTDGLVYVAGNEKNPGKLSNLVFPGITARIKDVRILTDYEMNRANFRRFTFMDYGTPSYNGEAEAKETDRYCRIAALVMEAERGTCSFRYTSDAGDSAEITVAKRGEEILTKVEPGLFCGAEFYEENDGGYMEIFVKVPAGQKIRWTVNTVSAGIGFFPIDTGLVMRRRDYCPHDMVIDGEDDRAAGLRWMNRQTGGQSMT
ncbi:MAG: hypothetical protein II889_10680 [Clostridia bacterium]|nr:hypothetical protein [Clostridia bacterium]